MYNLLNIQAPISTRHLYLDSEIVIYIFSRFLVVDSVLRACKPKIYSHALNSVLHLPHIVNSVHSRASKITTQRTTDSF